MSAEELERCVTKLGFKGAMAHGLTNGEFFDYKKYWPVFERAQALDVPIYMHPAYPHPDVVAAVHEQISQGTTFFALNEHMLLLAEEIVRAVPCAEKVRFTSSGTEATFFAMRAVRAYRKLDKVLKFEGGFHGMSDYGLMSMAPSEPLDFPAPTPDATGIPQSLLGDVLIAPFNDIETTSAIIERHSLGMGCS